MEETFDYIEVPQLQDIIDYLPINPVDEEDVIGYVHNITNLIAVNYRYEQYQFAYFGVHLLYMTYIYSTAWKISQMEPTRYKDAIVFARSYMGREKDLKIEDADSIFNFSLIPEKDIAKLFKIIDLDNTHIKMVSELIDYRNNMAHASGKIEILNKASCDAKTSSILDSITHIHNSMYKLIRKWYTSVLMDFCNDKYEGYTEPIDIINEYMIQNFKLSAKELLTCNDMSIKPLISENCNYESKLKNFKNVLKEYCINEGYF